MNCANCGDKSIRCDHCLFIDAREEISRLLAGLELIKQHMKTVSPTGYKLSSVYAIAASALEGGK